VRVVLTGGVFDDAMGAFALSAPENVLAGFLRELGHDVLGISSGRQLPPAVAGDVFHANHFGIAAYELALSGLRPFVFTSHNPFLVSDFPVEESRLEHALRGMTLRAADAVVALAAREADILSERFGVPRERFEVIPNGLDLSLYGPGEERPADSPVEFLAVGQLVPYKGHRFLFEALADVELPDWRLTLVSHQHSQRAALEEHARGLGIADRLTIVGPYGTAELVEAYRACDVFVQPSLAECFPVTVLEAMACGAVVVATDVGGVREEVGEAGLVVPPGDADALARALERVAGSADERRRRRADALALVARRYDGRAVARQHADLYARLAAGRRRPAPLRRRAARLATSAYAHRASVTRIVPDRVKRR
jgi:glycosyltransferase involved in cell wall biosynthesis